MKYLSKAILVFAISLFVMFPLGVTANALGSSTSSGIFEMSGDIYVNEGDAITGDVVTISGDIYINGTVSGNAVAPFGDIIVNGKVMGDAVTVTGRIRIGQNGRVSGNTVEALGGSVSNPRSFRRNPFTANPLSRIPSVVMSLFRAIILFMLTALVYVIMPDKVNEMSNTTAANFGKRLGIGVLTAIGTPIAMIVATILLIITLIGIIIVPFLWLAFLILGLVAVVPAYIFIGRKIVELGGNKNISAFAGLSAGVFIVWIIKTIFSFGGIFTSWINGLISLLVLSLGLGILLDYITTQRRIKKAARADYGPQGGYNPQGGYGPQNGYGPQGGGSYQEGPSQGPNQGWQQQGNAGPQNTGENNDNTNPGSENK